jgi:hypothetical protein
MKSARRVRVMVMMHTYLEEEFDATEKLPVLNNQFVSQNTP